MTAENPARPGMDPDDGLDRLSLGDLVRLAHAAARSLTRRLASPQALDEVVPVPEADAGSGDWGAMLPSGTGSAPEGEWPSAGDAAPGRQLPSEGGGFTAAASTLHATPANGHDTAPSEAIEGAGATPLPGDGPASTADPVGSEEPPDGVPPTTSDLTLPVLHQALESVGRSVTAAQMSLAGHTCEVFDNPPERSRLLGLPEGKTAFRDTADYLRGALRVDVSEAKRRIRWADSLRGSQAMAGEPLPPKLPRLAEAVQGGELDRATVEHISTAMSTARRIAHRAELDPATTDEMISAGEELLVDQSRAMDPRSLRKVCHHWVRWFEAVVDPDGKEPTDLGSPHLHGMVHKGRRNGFHQWTLSVTDSQHEILMTVAEAATNPRAKQHDDQRRWDHALGAEAAPEARTEAEATPASGAEDETEERTQPGPSADTDALAVAATDPRTRHQKQLDGLIACLSGALTMVDDNKLPWTGGMRPQVAVTIDYRTLLGDLVEAGTASADDLARFESSATFSGPVSPQNIRTLACDADIIPVVLGSDGQVLDVGRAQRLFPARLRQAIAARDGGCTAPGCSMPAPWCDVHHVEHWEHGGPTSADNGVLLCNHHHHAVHAGAWEIDMRSGRPWFIPAPYLDPRRQPQRNRFWRQ